MTTGRNLGIVDGYFYVVIIEKKLQFITLLTANCIVSHIENSKNDKGYYLEHVL